MASCGGRLSRGSTAAATGLGTDGDADGAPAAEHADRVGFIRQTHRIAGKRRAIKAHELEGILGILDAGLGQCHRALADQALIRPIEQHDADVRREAAQRALGFMGLDGAHERSGGRGQLGGELKMDLLGQLPRHPFLRVARRPEIGETLRGPLIGGEGADAAVATG